MRYVMSVSHMKGEMFRGEYRGDLVDSKLLDPSCHSKLMDPASCHNNKLLDPSSCHNKI
jgi:hypothetical protein